MFTGLIEQVGDIIDCQKTEKGLRLTIQSNYSDLVLGESIAIDGICLTVTQIIQQQFCCDVSAETCRVTTANHFSTGKKVNLERALQVGARLGGHFVLGHVDGICTVASIAKVGDCLEYVIELPEQTNLQYLISKGSVCLNGVSLTINRLTPKGFTIMLIPHTQLLTNLPLLQTGDPMNIEFDYLVKAVFNKPAAEHSYV